MREFAERLLQRLPPVHRLPLSGIGDRAMQDGKCKSTRCQDPSGPENAYMTLVCPVIIMGEGWLL